VVLAIGRTDFKVASAEAERKGRKSPERRSKIKVGSEGDIKGLLSTARTAASRMNGSNSTGLNLTHARDFSLYDNKPGDLVGEPNTERRVCLPVKH
jgi:hypothetical protein